MTTKGTCFSFGFGADGRLGLGDEETKYRPKRILGHQIMAKRNKAYKRSTISHISKHASPIERNTIFSHIACGARHSILISENGTVFAFGRNDKGQLGLGLKAFKAIRNTDKPSKEKVEQARRNRRMSSIARSRSPRNSLSTKESSGRRKKSKKKEKKILLCALWPSEINALRNIHASKAFCGTNHTIILDNRGKTFGFGLNDKGQVSEDKIENEIRSPIETGLYKHEYTRTLNVACSHESTYFIAQHKASQTLTSSEEETEIVDDITLNDGLLLNSNDNYNSANEMLLKNILGDINEFPSHEHDFMEKLMEQDRLPLHTSDTLYNTKEAKQWIHEIDNVKKMDDIKNGLMMAWENFEVKHEVYSSRNSGSHNTRYKMNKKK